MDVRFSIAIDGPAGSGKSTIAQIVAKKLNFKYINSGLFYRAIAYYMQLHNIIIDNVTDWNKEVLDKINLKWKDNNIILNNQVLNDILKSNKYSSLASQIAIIPKVRNFVNENILNISKKFNIVVDGRDIGTVVLPNASAKIFLDADVKTRAERRYNEILNNTGNITDMETIINQIIERDNRDYTRDIAPLKKADDAVLLDSSSMKIDEVVLEVLNIFYASASGEKIIND